MHSHHIMYAIMSLPAVVPLAGPMISTSFWDGVAFALPSAVATCGFLVLIGRTKRAVFLYAFSATGIMVALTAWALFLDLRGNRLVADDVVELAKPVFFFTVFIFCASLRWAAEDIRRYFTMPLFALVGVSALVAIVEFMPYAATNALSDLYVRARPSLQGKAIGVFATPYFAGSVYLLATAFAVSLYIFHKRVRYIVLALFFVGLAVATQSRTVFLALAAYIVVLLVVYNFYRRSIHGVWVKYKVWLKSIGLAALVPAVGAGMIVLFQDDLAYLLSGLDAYVLRFSDQLDRGQGSVYVRFSQIQYALVNNPWVLVGAGVGKGYAPSLESFYALYYYRYGAVGIVVYLAVWGGGLILAFKGLRDARGKGNDPCAVIFFSCCTFIPILPILSLASVITDQFRLYGVFYALLGVLVGTYIRVKALGARDEAHVICR